MSTPVLGTGVGDAPKWATRGDRVCKQGVLIPMLSNYRAATHVLREDTISGYAGRLFSSCLTREWDKVGREIVLPGMGVWPRDSDGGVDGKLSF